MIMLLNGWFVAVD